MGARKDGGRLRKHTRAQEELRESFVFRLHHLQEPSPISMTRHRQPACLHKHPTTTPSPPQPRRMPIFNHADAISEHLSSRGPVQERSALFSNRIAAGGEHPSVIHPVMSVCPAPPPSDGPRLHSLTHPTRHSAALQHQG